MEGRKFARAGSLSDVARAGSLSDISHFVGPFVRKPLPGGGAFVDSSTAINIVPFS